MKRFIRLGLFITITLITLTCGFAQNPADLKVLTIGDITQIDLKGNSITIKDAASYDLTPSANVGANGNGRGNAGGPAVPVGATISGRGGRRGGAGGGSRAAAGSAPTEFKIVVSGKTIFKEGDQEIKLSDLKVGDHIQIMSPKSGTKINAAEVMRTPKEQE